MRGTPARNRVGSSGGDIAGRDRSQDMAGCRLVRGGARNLLVAHPDSTGSGPRGIHGQMGTHDRVCVADVVVLPAAGVHALRGPLIGLGLVALGIALEFAQRMTGIRMFEISDMVAGALGVALGWLLASPRTPNLLYWCQRWLAPSADSPRRPSSTAEAHGSAERARLFLASLAVSALCRSGLPLSLTGSSLSSALGRAPAQHPASALVPQPSAPLRAPTRGSQTAPE